MDNFIVSARKYRPQQFNTVVGQNHITNTLKNAILNKQLAQAYLFCGPRGVGKTTCARIFAKTINCTKISDLGEACDNCESCLSFDSGASLNVYELDAASNNSVDDIRYLVDQVRIAPQLGEYKVYVIDEVHMLSNSAFNAFLKTLEEPPKHAKFILATTEKQKIIPTILSRCQVFNFNRIKTEDISNHLAFMANKEQVTFEPEALHVIAQKADGGLRDACSIFDQMVAFTGNNLTYKQIVENLNILDYDYYFKITDAFLSSNLPEIMVTFDNILKKGFDAHHFIIGLGEHLRNILVSKDPQTIVLIEVSESLKQNYLKQAQNCSINFLLKSLSIISKTDVNYKSAKNQRLLVEMALFQLTFLTVSADTEKKKDDLENVFENSSASIQKNPTPITKIEKESQIKYANKPIISIEQLKIKSGFSLNEIKTNIEVKPIILNPISEESPIINKIKTITNEDVKVAILKYAELKLIEGARQLSISLSTSEVQFENNVITITTNNEIQKEQLILEKHHVLDSLRSLLENNKITLEINTSKIETKIKAFKPVDVFKDMAEKNPIITNLKKTFDLEIEY